MRHIQNARVQITDERLKREQRLDEKRALIQRVKKAFQGSKTSTSLDVTGLTDTDPSRQSKKER